MKPGKEPHAVCERRIGQTWRKAILEKNRHRDNAPATAAFGHRHTRALKNGGK